MTLPDDHPLVLYSRGQISRHAAIQALHIRDYGALLVALGDHGLPMPMPTEAEIEDQVETFRTLMRS